MKKLIAISILALFMLCVNSFATETRTLTLGQTNNVLLDEANIWLYPSRILDYPTLAIGEFGYDPATGGSLEDFARFGIHFKVGRDNPFVLGAYFDNAAPLYPTSLGFDTAQFGRIDTLLDNRRLNLFYGNEIGGMNFGARLGLLQSSRSADATDDKTKTEFHYYDLNAGLTADDGAWDVAAKIAFGGFTDENALGKPVTDDHGYYDFDANARMFFTLNPNYTLIPHVGLSLGKHGIKYFNAPGGDGDIDTEDFADDYSRLSLQLGSGINYVPATNVLAVVDFGVQYDKRKYEQKDLNSDDGIDYIDESNKTDFYMPYFKIGLDADVFRWMDIRLGARSIWNRYTEEERLIDEKNKTNSADNDTYVGFGFHWNRLHIDTYTDPSLFLDGFNFLSGANNDMNFQISAVYEMM